MLKYNPSKREREASALKKREARNYADENYARIKRSKNISDEEKIYLEQDAERALNEAWQKRV